jgi:integrase
MAYHTLHYDAGTRTTPLDAILKTSRLRRNAGGYWQIVYSEPIEGSSGWRSRTLSTKSQDFATAQQQLTEWLTRATQQQHTERAGRAYTVGQLIELYLTAKVGQIEKTTVFSYRAIQKILGGLTPKEITQDVVRNYVSVRINLTTGAPAKSGTMRRDLAAMMTAIRYGVKKKLVPADDVPVIDLPGASDPRVRFMTHEQEHRFWSEAQNHGGQLGLFVALGLDTAARKSAILDLTWDRVDLTHGIIDFKDPRVKLSKKRRVAVPISSRLMPVLVAARDRSEGRARLFDSRLRFSYDAFVERLDMAWVTPHIMRHTWASLAAIDGCSLFHIAKMLGDTVATVEKTYAHLQPSHLRDIVDRRWAVSP